MSISKTFFCHARVTLQTGGEMVGKVYKVHHGEQLVSIVTEDHKNDEVSSLTVPAHAIRRIEPISPEQYEKSKARLDVHSVIKQHTDAFVDLGYHPVFAA